MTGSTTFTLDTLKCNAELQTFTVESGLTFLDDELQYLLLEHNNVKMMGWLKNYNIDTGIIKIMIERYNGGGGDSYTNWIITIIDQPITDVQVNYNKLKYLSSFSGQTYLTLDDFGDLANIVQKIYKMLNPFSDV